MQEKNEFTIFSVLRGLAIIAVVVMTLFPVYWMFTTAIKGPLDILNMPPKWVFQATFENFRYAFIDAEFMKYISNSLVITLTSTALVMLAGTPAAYSFARFNPGGGHLLFYIISTRMMPQIAVVIPYFIIFGTLGLIDTKLGLIITYTMFNLPIAIWLLNGFFKDVPVELEDAARIDGYTRFQVFWKIVVPLVAPGLAVTAVLCMMFAWNEFLFAFILSRSQAATITVGISSFWTQRGILWGPLSAAAVVAVVPMMVFTMLFQKYIVRGLTFGAVKG
jgi:multiple sugar transport system permease protein